MSRATNFDDAVFELPTGNLIQPLSIFKLLEFEVDNVAQPAPEVVEEENIDYGLTDPNQQQESSPEAHEDSRPATTDDIQPIMAAAENLSEFRDSEHYLFCRDSDSESAPEDSDNESEGNEGAVEIFATPEDFINDQAGAA